MLTDLDIWNGASGVHLQGQVGDLHACLSI